MAATVLTLVLTVILGGGLWVLIGSRLRLDPDERQNEVLNLLVFLGALLPVAFVVVFFAMEHL